MGSWIIIERNRWAHCHQVWHVGFLLLCMAAVVLACMFSFASLVILSAREKFVSLWISLIERNHITFSRLLEKACFFYEITWKCSPGVLVIMYGYRCSCLYVVLCVSPNFFHWEKLIFLSITLCCLFFFHLVAWKCSLPPCICVRHMGFLLLCMDAVVVACMLSFSCVNIDKFVSLGISLMRERCSPGVLVILHGNLCSRSYVVFCVSPNFSQICLTERIYLFLHFLSLCFYQVSLDKHLSYGDFSHWEKFYLSIWLTVTMVCVNNIMLWCLLVGFINIQNHLGSVFSLSSNGMSHRRMFWCCGCYLT